jgi:hypothetical protein
MARRLGEVMRFCHGCAAIAGSLPAHYKSITAFQVDPLAPLPYTLPHAIVGWAVLRWMYLPVVVRSGDKASSPLSLYASLADPAASFRRRAQPTGGVLPPRLQPVPLVAPWYA